MLNDLKEKGKKYIMIFMETIDIHIHGGFGINFDFASPKEINEFAELANKNGIRAFCPTLTGNTPEYLYERLEVIKEAKSKQKENEALIIGANLEGTFLSKEKSGVQNPKVFMSPSVENFKKIAKDHEDIVKIVVIAPETGNSKELINYLKAREIKVHFGHTMTNSTEGADGICHLFNAMEQLTHKHKTLASSALNDKNVYTELIADTVHVTEDILKLTFKIRPLDKILLISDALPVAKSGLDFVEFCGKKVFNNGLDEKGTLGGSCKLLPEIVENLIAKGFITADIAKKLAYQNQIEYLKLDI